MSNISNVGKMVNNMSTANMEDLINETNNETIIEETLRYVTEGILLTGVSIFGIIANCISVLVLSRPEMRYSFNQMLLLLAGYDILYLVAAMFIFGLPLLSSNYRLEVYPLILPVTFGIAHIARVGSVLMTLSVTIERYVAISKPLYTEKKKLKNLLIVFAGAFSILYNIPRFFEFETVWKTTTVSNPEDGTNSTTGGWKLQATILRQDQNYLMYYLFWSKLILVELGPYLVVALLNTIIIICVRTSSSLQPRTNQATTRELHMARVLTLIVFLFIFCQSFKLIPDMYEIYSCAIWSKKDWTPPECWSQTPRGINYISQLSHLFLSINSSANFLVYVASGTKFRTTLIKITTRRRRPSTSRFSLAERGYEASLRRRSTQVTRFSCILRSRQNSTAPDWLHKNSNAGLHEAERNLMEMRNMDPEDLHVKLENYSSMRMK